MRKNSFILACALCILTGHGAYAATIKADAFLCEGEFEVTLPAREKWTQDGGQLLMKVANNSVTFAQGQIKVAQALGGLAQREEQIQTARFGNSGSGYAARGAGARADEKTAAEKLTIYQRMVSTCAASGPSPLAAEVIERKVISGVSKVRTVFNGSSTELWVRNTDLAD